MHSLHFQENIHPFGFCYSPSFCKWTTIAPMLTERCRFTLNVVEDKLYAIGGASENVEDIAEPAAAAETECCACEKYDPATGTYTHAQLILIFFKISFVFSLKILFLLFRRFLDSYLSFT